jgi:hypothetical protein
VDALKIEDPMLLALADTLVGELRRPGPASNLLVDSVAQALCLHTLRAYPLCDHPLRNDTGFGGEIRLQFAKPFFGIGMAAPPLARTWRRGLRRGSLPLPGLTRLKNSGDFLERKPYPWRSALGVWRVARLTSRVMCD